jgi:hypothetical protein
VDIHRTVRHQVDHRALERHGEQQQPRPGEEEDGDQLAELFPLPRSHNNRKHFSSQGSGELAVEVREVSGDPIRTSRRRARFQNVEPITQLQAQVHIFFTASNCFSFRFFKTFANDDVIVRNQFSTENGVNKERFVAGWFNTLVIRSNRVRYTLH